MDHAAQHLVAAAQADHLAAVTQVLADRLLPAPRAQPVEVGTHRLGTGQHDQVGGRRRFARPDPAEIDLRMQAQRVEIVVVGGARIGRGNHLQFRILLVADGRRRNGILGIEHQAVQIGQHGQHRLAGSRFQPIESGFEQADVAAETVDHEAKHTVLFGG